MPTSTTISARRIPCRMPLAAPRADCFSESCRRGLETRRAGNSPASTPVNTDTPNVKSSTAGRIVMSCDGG